MEKIKIETPYIELDSLLKFVDVVATGGHAKILIQEGEVQVNGETEYRRGKKCYPGDVINLGDYEFMVERE